MSDLLVETEDLARERERYEEEQSVYEYETGPAAPCVDEYFDLRPWLKRTRYLPGSEPAGGGYWDHS